MYFDISEAVMRTVSSGEKPKEIFSYKVVPV